MKQAPVPADLDLSSLDYLPLMVNRLLSSDTWLLATGDEAKAAVTLWCRAWHQVPAGSLPSDDRLLAALSGAGSKWKKVKAVALRGFAVCEDGRLYHTVLCDEALEAHKKRVQWREKKRQQREGQTQTAPPHVPEDIPGDIRGDKVEDTPDTSPPSPSFTGRDGTSSEAKASGAEAPADPVKDLFDSGVKILTNLGVPTKSARSLVGQCRKEFGADGPVFDLLLDIERKRVTEPQAYIEAAILRHKQPKVTPIGRAWA